MTKCRIKPRQIMTKERYLVTDSPHLYPWAKDFIVDHKTCIADLKTMDIISCDTETEGLTFTKHKLLSIQLGNADRQYVIPYVKEFKKRYYRIFYKPILFHNAIFDLVFLYIIGIFPDKVLDTFLLEKIMSLGINGHRRDLGTLAKRYLDIDLDKDYQQEISSGIIDIRSFDYAADDVMVLEPILNAQKQHCIRTRRDPTLLTAAKEEFDFSRCLAYIEFCGMYQNWSKAFRLAREYEAEEFNKWKKVRDWVKEKFDIDDFIPSSNQQCLEVIHKLGLRPVDHKTNKPTTNGKVLAMLDHPFIDLLLDYRAYAKLVSTYGRSFKDNLTLSKVRAKVEENINKYTKSNGGRIHTKFKQLVSTGRTSSGDSRNGNFPNLQNLPNDDRYRATFEPEGSNVFVVCDYSSQEGVVLADLSGEPSMIDFYQNGDGDIHSFSTKQLWPEKFGHMESSVIKKEHSDFRSRAKAATFAINYGGNGSTIARNLGVSKKVGEDVYARYMAAFPKLKEFFEKCRDEAMARGYSLMCAATGHKRFIGGMRKYREIMKRGLHTATDEDRNLIKGIQAYFRSQVLNAPVQGLSAVMSKRAGSYFYDWILENKYLGKVKIVNFIHDEYVVECTEAMAEEVSAALKDCMERAGNELLTRLKIKAEPSIEKYWTK